MSRSRKYRIKRSILADLPKNEVPWRDWALELILLAELATRNDGPSLALQLRESLSRHTGHCFDGSMSSWRALCDDTAKADRLVSVRSENPAFFDGANWAVLSLFDMAVPGEDGSLPPPSKKQTLRILYVLAGMATPRSRMSTRVKALHNLMQSDDLKHHQRLREAISVFTDNNSRDSSLARGHWIGMRFLRPGVNVDYIVAMLNFGAELPCMGVQYMPPKRRPWPLPGLAEIATALDILYDKFIHAFAPPVFADANDVLIGNLVRIRQLATRILTACSDDDGLLAEIVLRSMSDTAIQLRWLLLKNDKTLYEQFKERSFATERSALERLQKDMEAKGLSKEAAWNAVRDLYHGLSKRLGRWPELLDVVYGPWSGVPTASMARDVADASLTTTYQRTSDATHGSWRSLEKYQLARCENPLHVPHFIAAPESARSAGVVPALSALLIQISVLDHAIHVVAEGSPMLESVEQQRSLLRAWITEHQTELGIFDWESISE